MDVILLERLGRLGSVGDVVKVKNGYARNFLIPMKKALRASDENKKVFEERRHIIEEQNAKAKSAAEERAKAFEGIKLNLMRQASQEGKLYGSIGVRDIADELKAIGHDIPKSQIVIPKAIKTTGEFSVRLSLHADVIATVPVVVSRSEHEM